MEIILIWLFFGMIGMALGSKKGYSLPVAFIAGVLLGPFSLLMVFVSSSKKKCPQCAEWVQVEAQVCRFCQHKFDPAAIQQSGLKDCPNCHSVIPVTANVCKFCQHKFETRPSGMVLKE